MNIRAAFSFILIVLTALGCTSAIAGPPESSALNVNVVNGPDKPIPVEVQQQAPTPVFLHFQLTESGDWRSDEYQVPAGTTLKTTFVGVTMDGADSDTHNVNAGVQMWLSFGDGSGGTCNHPYEEECHVSIPLIALNNTDTGANMGAYYPSAVQPAAIQVPAGATLFMRLFGSSYPGTLGFVHVNIAGVLVPAGQP